MPNLTRAEQIAWNADFNRYFKAEEQAEKRRVAIDELIDYKTEEALNNETVFRTLNQNYEVIDSGQVMRALRSLNVAIKRFNMLHNIIEESATTEMDQKVARLARIDVDAVFTALSNIQQKFDAAIAYEAEEETDGSMA